MNTRTHAGVPPHMRVAGTAPSLRITPEAVPVDFGWSQHMAAPRERGQDFQITYVHGGPPLHQGDVVFIRANFLVVDPSPLEDALPGSHDGSSVEEQESLARLYLSAWKAGALGLQMRWPDQANYVELVADDGDASAKWAIPGPMISNPQFRVLPVLVRSESVQPGDHFTISVRRACSAAVRNTGGIATNANEHAFVAAIGRQRPGGDEASREWQVVDDVQGGWMLPRTASEVHAVAPTQVQAGVPVRLRLAVLDDVDNHVPDWAGTLRLACTDPAAELPARVTLGAEDGGTASIPVTLHTPGRCWWPRRRRSGARCGATITCTPGAATARASR